MAPDPRLLCADHTWAAPQLLSTLPTLPLAPHQPLPTCTPRGKLVLPLQAGEGSPVEQRAVENPLEAVPQGHLPGAPRCKAEGEGQPGLLCPAPMAPPPVPLAWNYRVFRPPRPFPPDGSSPWRQEAESQMEPQLGSVSPSILGKVPLRPPSCQLPATRHPQTLHRAPSSGHHPPPQLS